MGITAQPSPWAWLNPLSWGNPQANAPAPPPVNALAAPPANALAASPQASPSGLLGNFGVNPLLQPFLSPNARSNALSMAGLQFAGDIMKGAGPSYTPRSFGQIFGGAAAPAAQTYQKSLMGDVNQALTGMKLGQLTSQAALAKRKAEALKQLGILNPTDPDYGIKRKKLFAMAYPEKAAEAVFRKKNLKVVGNKKDGFYSFNPENAEWSLIKAGAGADWKAPTKFIQVVDKATKKTLGTFPNNAKELAPGGKYYGAANTEGLQFYAVGSITGTPKDLPGVGGDIKPSPGADKLLDKTIIDMTNTISNIVTLKSQFENDFQKVFPRIGMQILALKDKVGTLTEDEADKLTRFSQFKQTASANLNAYIKAITGAQMSLPEAQRLKLDMPNPGTGLFDGDSPTTFKAKMARVLERLKLARARAMIMRQQGLKFKYDQHGNIDSKSIESGAIISIDNMKAVIKARGVKLAKKYESEGFDVTQIKTKVAADLNTEFGW